MSWSVDDSRAPTVKEGVYPTVTEAIRMARNAGLAVWLHADDCTTTDEELGPRCPCQPVRVDCGQPR